MKKVLIASLALSLSSPLFAQVAVSDPTVAPISIVGTTSFHEQNISLQGVNYQVAITVPYTFGKFTAKDMRQAEKQLTPLVDKVIDDVSCNYVAFSQEYNDEVNQKVAEVVAKHYGLPATAVKASVAL